jgi:hypothetical protein
VNIPFDRIFGKLEDSMGVSCVEIKGLKFVFRLMTHNEYVEIQKWVEETQPTSYEIYHKICEKCLVLPQGDVRDMKQLMDLPVYMDIMPQLADAIIKVSGVVPLHNGLLN